MDRSFLSRPPIITASREFVCVRLTTYEDPEEGKFLKSFQVTRSGELENTVFTILSPDGKRQLARASRSTNQTFGNADRMAETMNRIAQSYAGKTPGKPQELPRVSNLRLAVNVAACDHQPLVVLFAPQERERRDLVARLTPLAWSEPFLGRFIYVVVHEDRELAALPGAKAEASVLVVQPDRFGLNGIVLTRVGLKGTAEELVQCLKEGMKRYQHEEESFERHVREGRQRGVFWQTVMDVTDPMERRARERGRSSNSRPE